MARTHVEETVLIAGSGRSGTTWLANLVNHDRRYAYYFEPMHQHQSPEFSMFRQHQFLPVDHPPWPLLTPWLRLFLDGSRNPWINQQNPSPDSNRVLIKIIRGNLLLPWLQRNLPWLKLVLMLRHPLAILHSKRKLGWASDTKLVFEQDGIANLFPDIPAVWFDNAGDVEQHVGLWALQTAIPLGGLEMNQVHVVFYEDLVQHGSRELTRLAAFLGHEYDPSAEAGLRVASSVSRKESAVRTGGDPLRSWMEHVSESERDRAGEVLERFGLGGLYNPHEPLPVLR